MTNKLTTRTATNADIPFLSRIEYEASLPPLNRCFWEDLLEDTQTSTLALIEAVMRAGASNWGEVTDFLILEENGKPVAAAAGYEPNQEDYCPLRISGLVKVAQELNWSEKTMTIFRDRYELLWGGDYRPFFLTPHAPWIIENVAVLPEARGRGLGKILLKALLEKGRSQHYTHAGIMVINGNEIARRTYESIGFKPYQTFYGDYFRDQFNIQFPGITKFGFCYE